MGSQQSRSLQRELRRTYAVGVGSSAGSDGSAQMAAAVQRHALDVLRPVLSTIWIEAEPQSDAWPVEVLAEGARLADLACRQHTEWAGRPRRRGTGPATCELDPGDDVHFGLARALAPHTVTMESMSRDGRLVHVRERTPNGPAGPASSSPVILRLTGAELAELSSRVGLTIEPLNPEPDVDHLRWWPRPWGERLVAVLVLIFSVFQLARGLHGATGAGQAVSAVIFSAGFSVMGIVLLPRLVRRRQRSR